MSRLPSDLLANDTNTKKEKNSLDDSVQEFKFAALTRFSTVTGTTTSVIHNIKNNEQVTGKRREGH